MDNKVENRRAFIINFVYFCIFIALYYVAVKFAFGYIFPFAVAVALAVFLQRPIKKIKSRFKLKNHGPVSIILVLLIVILILSVVGLLCGIIISELKEFIAYLFGQFSSVGEIVDMLKDTILKIVVKLPAGVRTTASASVTEFFSRFDSESFSIDMSILSAPLSGAWTVVKSIPTTLVAIIVTIISCVFMTADYEMIKELFLGLFSKEKRHTIVEAKHTVTKGIAKLFKAYATIMLITFSEMFLGLYLLKVIGVYEGGYIAIISFVTCIVDIIPVLGTGTVVIPWAIYNLALGDIGLGIGLLIIYAVITVIRQIVEPKLVANQVGLPAIITIMAMFIGSKLFGALGIIILPLTVVVLKLMLDEGIIGHQKLEKPLSSDDAENGDGKPKAKRRLFAGKKSSSDDAAED